MKSRVSRYFLRSDRFFEKSVSVPRTKFIFEGFIGITIVGDSARPELSNLCHDFVPVFEFGDNSSDSKEFLSGTESFHGDHPMATQFFKWSVHPGSSFAR
jgi:hypothetical protein